MTTTTGDTSGPRVPGRSGTAPTPARVRRARVAYVVRVAVSTVLYYSGFLGLYQAMVMRRRAVVLMYHRVLAADERARTASHPALVVDADTFARQMALLKKRFHVLTVDELADRMARGEALPDRSCLITFDDGWRDNFVHALPVLRRHGLPALIFLPVNFIGRRRLFWQESLTHALLHAVADVRRRPAQRPVFERILAPLRLGAVLDIADADPRARVIDAITTQKGVDPATIERLVQELGQALEHEAPDGADVDGFMNWDEVEEMARAGVAFGGHGAEHRLLTYATESQVDAEIRESKAVIDARFPRTAPTFSYPNGYLTPAIADKVQAAGYRLAFTTSRGFVESGHDRFTVRRLNIHESGTNTTPLFFARVLGIL